jgi:hypothetical protein
MNNEQKFNKGDLVEWAGATVGEWSEQQLGIVMNTKIPQEEDPHDVFVLWYDGDENWERPPNLKLVAKAK